MTNHPVQMFNYNTWANQTILQRIKELPSTVLQQEVNTTFPTIGEALAHIYALDKCWFQVLSGTSMSKALEACLPLQQETFRYSVDEFAIAFSELAEQYRAWFRSQEDLEQALVVENPYAGTRSIRLSEIVLQVVNHGTYHRGNISTMLRQLGHASIMTDYSLFWYQQPVESI
ncbi:damage-inducible protein DinB [Paenibacillus sp. HJL G12]|uniref:Damage-inducible protein DinB n=1 Tax=Paenibacillus dendrobii TaxID=2691084 RepID=A0A7X3IIH9_9BACL|nr:DinB family protein [Paenibacillus dendrobii]MWV42692.1 damage-inducible protein DinB [Paenibacillus dendrobii]